MGPCYRPPPTLPMGSIRRRCQKRRRGSCSSRGCSAAIGPLNGVGNGGCAGTSGDSRSLYVRRRASEARSFGHPALGSRHPLPRHPRDPAQHPDHRLRDGYRHRSADGDRHGAGRRHRRHPSQFRRRGPGRAGAAGQEVRIRNGGQSADHRPRRDAVGRAGADERSRLLRHSGGDRRRQGHARQAGRHSHQPRRALCHRSAGRRSRN